MGRYKHWRGSIDKPILELLTFGQNPFLETEPDILTIVCYFLAASAAKNCEKNAVIQSAASAASARGGCASSRLDHGLKFYVILEILRNPWRLR